MNITSWRYVNDVTQISINKGCYWLVLLRLEVLSGSHGILIFCFEKCKQPDMLVSPKAATLRLQILENYGSHYHTNHLYNAEN